MLNQNYILIATASILFLNSCQSLKTESRVTIEPVFAEADSFVNPYGKMIYTRYD